MPQPSQDESEGQEGRHNPQRRGGGNGINRRGRRGRGSYRGAARFNSQRPFRAEGPRNISEPQTTRYGAASFGGVRGRGGVRSPRLVSRAACGGQPGRFGFGAAYPPPIRSNASQTLDGLKRYSRTEQQHIRHLRREITTLRENVDNLLAELAIGNDEVRTLGPQIASARTNHDDPDAMEVDSVSLATADLTARAAELTLNERNGDTNAETEAEAEVHRTKTQAELTNGDLEEDACVSEMAAALAKLDAERTLLCLAKRKGQTDA